MARITLYRGNEVREISAENVDKYLANGWTADRPKVSKKTKSAEKKPATETDEA